LKKTFIIAEAGVNHNGSLEVAKKLIDAAVEAKVDAVKFQTFKTENLVCKNAIKAEYQEKTTSKNESQFQMLKKLELDIETHKILMAYCKEKKIMFLSAAFDLESIDVLNNLGIEIFKIPSGEITNYPYLRKIGTLRKKVILSTGMSYIEEIRDAIKVLKENGTTDIIVLHCNTEYPTPMEDVNLNAMKTIANKFGVKVGYSDHTKGIEVPIAAVALGATIIEKHFTLDRHLEGPDHKASLEPEELKAMVNAIRNIEKALGSVDKVISTSEQKNIAVARKSIVAATKIREGELFSETNLTVKRPGTGISPMLWDTIIGCKANKTYQPEDMIEL